MRFLQDANSEALSPPAELEVVYKVKVATEPLANALIADIETVNGWFGRQFVRQVEKFDPRYRIDAVRLEQPWTVHDWILKDHTIGKKVTPGNSESNAGVIVGIAVGCVLGVGVLCAIGVGFMRQKSHAG